MDQPGKCLTAGCSGEVHCRGLCVPCYAQFRKMVRRKEISDRKAVERGLVLPASPGRRPSAFRDAVTAATK
jgi:hypothetical protein